jgi:hypothetical protein
LLKNLYVDKKEHVLFFNKKEKMKRSKEAVYQQTTTAILQLPVELLIQIGNWLDLYALHSFWQVIVDAGFWARIFDLSTRNCNKNYHLIRNRWSIPGFLC